MNLHPELVKRGEGFPGPHKCGDCHVEIFNEWAESLHAESYISEEFKSSTNDYEFKFCLGCHVPETIFTPSMEEVAPRTYNLEDGVDCQSCHLTIDCTLAGPHVGISPHPIQKKEELYLVSELCGKCHIDTFKEYLKHVGNGQGETCQDCHMPAVDRKLIQNEPWQKIHKRKEGKAHTFSSSDALMNTKDFIKMSFAEIQKESCQIKGVLEVENTMANHSIPTGRYGYREILLLINLKNSVGKIIRTKQESMFIELGTHLKPEERRTFPFTFDIDDIGDGMKVLEAYIYKTDFNRTKKVLLAEVEYKIR